MTFTIEPENPADFNNMLEAKQYQKIWDENSEKILEAFKNTTGLEFHGANIDAIAITKRNGSIAGKPGAPMELVGDNRSEEYKLATMIHELAHRLLSRNSLGLVALGLADPELGTGTREDITAWESEMHHRHIYIFLYDMIANNFEPKFAEAYIKYETRYHDDEDDPHTKAWGWAMSMTQEDRRRAVARLTSHTVGPDGWDDEPLITPRRDPEQWYRYLVGESTDDGQRPKVQKHSA